MSPIWPLTAAALPVRMLKHTPDTMNLCLMDCASESIASDRDESGLPALSALRPPLSLSLAPHLHALPHHHPASRKP